jgi:hypothetical protein
MEDLQEFERYMGHLNEGLGHSDRHAGLRGYTTGLMSPLQRQSVEPMAAHLDPLNVRSRHQSLHHFVADANWSDECMLLGICQWVVPLMDFSDGGWWIIDDTGFPKQGWHSVGVARQYCGDAGQAGQLSGGSERVAGLRGGQHSGGVAAVPSPRVGRRRGPTREGPRARSARVRHQASDCAAADRTSAGPGGAQALRVGRRRLMAWTRRFANACVQRTATRSAANRARRNGCSSSGPRATKSR